MRSVAPHSAGSAASQKSWLVLNLKPMLGRFTTTTLQTIHTANDSSSAGIEIQRLMFAIALPSRTQNALSSGVQMSRTVPMRGRVVTVWVVMAIPSSVGEVHRNGMVAALGGLERAHFGEVHPHERDPHDAEHQHEGGAAHAGEVHQRAEHDRQDEAAHAAGEAHHTRHDADVLRVVVGDVLEDG